MLEETVVREAFRQDQLSNKILQDIHEDVFARHDL